MCVWGCFPKKCESCCLQHGLRRKKRKLWPEPEREADSAFFPVLACTHTCFSAFPLSWVSFGFGVCSCCYYICLSSHALRCLLTQFLSLCPSVPLSLFLLILTSVCPSLCLSCFPLKRLRKHASLCVSSSLPVSRSY